MTAIVRVEKIDGITFGAVDGHGLCRDVDLAEFLGFSRARDIRKIIERYAGSAAIGSVFSRAAMAPGLLRGKTQTTVAVTEFWLTRKQAIFIAAKSGTERADELLSDVIDRFLAYEAALKETDRIYLYLRDVPDERWEQLFKRKVADAIATLMQRKIDWTRGFPVFLCGKVGEIYALVLGKAVHEALRANKKEDRARGLRMHQRLTPEARQLMNVELGVIESFALQCGSEEELWARLASRYQGAPFQLSFAPSAPSANSLTA